MDCAAFLDDRSFGSQLLSEVINEKWEATSEGVTTGSVGGGVVVVEGGVVGARCLAPAVIEPLIIP